MQVSQDVLAVLDKATISGPNLTLGSGQLDRKFYVKVAKTIETAGGKWNRKAGCHVFSEDAAEALEPIFLTGHITSARDEFGFFETPAGVVEQMIGMAEVRSDHTCLEPSAGRGAIAFPLAKLCARVDCHEIQDRNLSFLRDNAPPNVSFGAGRDFLSVLANPDFDRVVMNPPFSKLADAKHILHAFDFLKPGGRLVSVASAAARFREVGAYNALRSLIKEHGYIDDLPEGSFKPSGTSVNTVLIVLQK